MIVKKIHGEAGESNWNGLAFRLSVLRIYVQKKAEKSIGLISKFNLPKKNFKKHKGLKIFIQKNLF
ncbi:MAG: hypothetical protein CM15mP26_2770 [Actinomycetota bacterium]|nr:MAG: hypothetical protein CM15mP26_2770 [Actinomycetota bacterium]